MNNFRAKLGQKKTFFPVIHTLSDEQVLESARIAADSGADGVFLISSVLNVLKRKTPMKKQKTPPDQLRIKLSNRRPVLITRAVWPVIAMASSRGTHEETGGEHEASIRVRQHASGRMRVVYGVCKYGEGKTVRSGALVANVPSDWPQADEERALEARTASVLVDVGNELGCDDLASRCLDRLPAERL